MSNTLCPLGEFTVGLKICPTPFHNWSNFFYYSRMITYEKTSYCSWIWNILHKTCPPRAYDVFHNFYFDFTNKTQKTLLVVTTYLQEVSKWTQNMHVGNTMIWWHSLVAYIVAYIRYQGWISNKITECAYQKMDQFIDKSRIVDQFSPPFTWCKSHCSPFSS